MTRLEQLLRLVALEPNDPLSHYSLGIEYINLEEWDHAVSAFDRAIASDAKYSAAYYHKARAQIHAGKHDAARQTIASGLAVARAAGDWHTQNEMTTLLESIP
ncbi:MAG: tetratricopeptide repeat protein [Planctomycetes bacterium]|nr:tetratricopeptide repeat protein [Planctomycetota bacterium]